MRPLAAPVAKKESPLFSSLQRASSIGSSSLARSASIIHRNATPNSQLSSRATTPVHDSLAPPTPINHDDYDITNMNDSLLLPPPLLRQGPPVQVLDELELRQKNLSRIDESQDVANVSSNVTDPMTRTQIQTFTRWLNVHLVAASSDARIRDLTLDLRDGTRLLLLIEILTKAEMSYHPDGESEIYVPPAERGTMRIHRVNNVNKALRVIRDALAPQPLDNCGAEDIVDGRLNITLGLVWLLIRRFQVSAIARTLLPDSTHVHMDRVNAVSLTDAREALLKWVRDQLQSRDETKSLPVEDFDVSWRDGRVLLGLVFVRAPRLVDPNRLKVSVLSEEASVTDALARLQDAFYLAERHFGVPRLLDADDVARPWRPDDKSILTYLSSVYLQFIKRDHPIDLDMEKTAVSLHNAKKILSEWESQMDLLEEELQREINRFTQGCTENLTNLNIPVSVALESLSTLFQSMKLIVIPALPSAEILLASTLDHGLTAKSRFASLESALRVFSERLNGAQKFVLDFIPVASTLDLNSEERCDPNSEVNAWLGHMSIHLEKCAGQFRPYLNSSPRVTPLNVSVIQIETSPPVLSSEPNDDNRKSLDVLSSFAARARTELHLTLPEMVKFLESQLATMEMAARDAQSSQRLLFRKQQDLIQAWQSLAQCLNSYFALHNQWKALVETDAAFDEEFVEDSRALADIVTLLARRKHQLSKLERDFETFCSSYQIVLGNFNLISERMSSSNGKVIEDLSLLSQVLEQFKQDAEFRVKYRKWRFNMDDLLNSCKQWITSRQAQLQHWLLQSPRCFEAGAVVNKSSRLSWQSIAQAASGKRHSWSLKPVHSTDYASGYAVALQSAIASFQEQSIQQSSVFAELDVLCHEAQENWLDSTLHQRIQDEVQIPRTQLAALLEEAQRELTIVQQLVRYHKEIAPHKELVRQWSTWHEQNQVTASMQQYVQKVNAVRSWTSETISEMSVSDELFVQNVNQWLDRLTSALNSVNIAQHTFDIESRHENWQNEQAALLRDLNDAKERMNWFKEDLIVANDVRPLFVILASLESRLLLAESRASECLARHDPSTSLQDRLHPIQTELISILKQLRQGVNALDDMKSKLRSASAFKEWIQVSGFKEKSHNLEQRVESLKYTLQRALDASLQQSTRDGVRVLFDEWRKKHESLTVSLNSTVVLRLRPSATIIGTASLEEILISDMHDQGQDLSDLDMSSSSLREKLVQIREQVHSIRIHRTAGEGDGAESWLRGVDADLEACGTQLSALESAIISRRDQAKHESICIQYLKLFYPIRVTVHEYLHSARARRNAIFSSLSSLEQLQPEAVPSMALVDESQWRHQEAVDRFTSESVGLKRLAAYFSESVEPLSAQLGVSPLLNVFHEIQTEHRSLLEDETLLLALHKSIDNDLASYRQVTLLVRQLKQIESHLHDSTITMDAVGTQRDQLERLSKEFVAVLDRSHAIGDLVSGLLNLTLQTSDRLLQEQKLKELVASGHTLLQNMDLSLTWLAEHHARLNEIVSSRQSSSAILEQISALELGSSAQMHRLSLIDERLNALIKEDSFSQSELKSTIVEKQQLLKSKWDLWQATLLQQKQQNSREYQLSLLQQKCTTLAGQMQVQWMNLSDDSFTQAEHFLQQWTESISGLQSIGSSLDASDLEEIVTLQTSVSQFTFQLSERRILYQQTSACRALIQEHVHMQQTLTDQLKRVAEHPLPKLEESTAIYIPETQQRLEQELQLLSSLSSTLQDRTKEYLESGSRIEHSLQVELMRNRAESDRLLAVLESAVASRKTQVEMHLNLQKFEQTSNTLMASMLAQCRKLSSEEAAQDYVIRSCTELLQQSKDHLMQNAAVTESIPRLNAIRQQLNASREQLKVLLGQRQREAAHKQIQETYEKRIQDIRQSLRSVARIELWHKLDRDMQEKAALLDDEMARTEIAAQVSQVDRQMNQQSQSLDAIDLELLRLKTHYGVDAVAPLMQLAEETRLVLNQVKLEFEETLALSLRKLQEAAQNHAAALEIEYWMTAAQAAALSLHDTFSQELGEDNGKERNNALIDLQLRLDDFNPTVQAYLDGATQLLKVENASQPDTALNKILRVRSETVKRRWQDLQAQLHEVALVGRRRVQLNSYAQESESLSKWLKDYNNQMQELDTALQHVVDWCDRDGLDTQWDDVDVDTSLDSVSSALNEIQKGLEQLVAVRLEVLATQRDSLLQKDMKLRPRQQMDVSHRYEQLIQQSDAMREWTLLRQSSLEDARLWYQVRQTLDEGEVLAKLVQSALMAVSVTTQPTDLWYRTERVVEEVMPSGEKLLQTAGSLVQQTRLPPRLDRRYQELQGKWRELKETLVETQARIKTHPVTMPVVTRMLQQRRQRTASLMKPLTAVQYEEPNISLPVVRYSRIPTWNGMPSKPWSVLNARKLSDSSIELGLLSSRIPVSVHRFMQSRDSGIVSSGGEMVTESAQGNVDLHSRLPLWQGPSSNNVNGTDHDDSNQGQVWPINHYEANPNDPVDCKVAEVINHTIFSVRVKYLGGGYYLFGESSETQRRLFCRVVNTSTVMVRIGGGWQELSDFLLDHYATLAGNESWQPYSEPIVKRTRSEMEKARMDRKFHLVSEIDNEIEAIKQDWEFHASL